MKNIAILSFALVLVSASVTNSAITTVSYQVSASADDGFAWSATEQDISSSYLMIGDDRTYTAPYYMSAMRFNNVNIPRGATIIHGRLKISSIDQEYRGRIYGIIQAEATDEAIDFASRYIADANTTITAVAWDHKTAWASNTYYTSPDISSMVQEIIDRPGWNSGDSMAMLYHTRADSGKSRKFASYEYNPALVTILEITYETFYISGYIRDPNGYPVGGVKLLAGSGVKEIESDLDGYYSIQVPPGWTGRVTPSLYGWRTFPDSRYYSNVQSDMNDQDFQALALPATVYWSVTGGGIRRMKLDGSTEEDFLSVGASGIKFDMSEDKIYWTGGGIWRANIDGTDVEQLLSTSPRRIDLDLRGRKIYWADNSHPEKIERANLDGSGREVILDIVNSLNIHEPVDVAVDSDNGKMYWIDEQKMRIYRADLDGSSQEIVLGTGASAPRDLELDLRENKMYWSDLNANIIRRSNLNGTEVETVTTGIRPYGMALDIYGGKVYLGTQGLTPKIYRANFDGSEVEIVTEGDRCNGLAIYAPVRYCSSSGGFGKPYINSVELGDIFNSGTANDGYSYYSSLSTSLKLGVDYEIIITNGSIFDNNDQCGIWIDWNQDGDFDDIDEDILVTGGPDIFIGSFATPTNSVLGHTRMRIRLSRASHTLDSCGESINGEVEDYIVHIQPITFGGGLGTEAEPFLIETAEHMQLIGASSANWSKNFKLVTDINMGDFDGRGERESFNVIGDSVRGPFTGVFDGNNHVINSLTYQTSGENDVGLFGYVNDDNAEIKNLIMVDPNINVVPGVRIGSIVGKLERGKVLDCYVENGIVIAGGSSFNGVGGLVGNNGGIVENCHFEGTVAGSGGWKGGLVGFNTSLPTQGSIINSTSSGNVSGSGNIGGLLGFNFGTVDECSANCSVTSTGLYTGGLVGNQSTNGSIRNSTSQGTVSGTSYVGGIIGRIQNGGLYDSFSNSDVIATGTYVGGLVGHNDSAVEISNCHATGSVTSSGNAVGGLVGTNQGLNGPGLVINCYATGNVSGASQVGGFVGYNVYEQARIINCFSTGNVNGGNVIGGFVGENRGDKFVTSGPAEISNCYSTGDVFGNDTIGGFVGKNYGYDGTAKISKCYATGVVLGSSNVGGLVGQNIGFPGFDWQGYARIYDCFWDKENSGLNSMCGSEGSNASGCCDSCGKTTEQMQLAGTFESAGWDFTTPIWEICEGTNYPKLTWQILVSDFICPDGINFKDFSVLASSWLSSHGEIDWNPGCDILDPNDDVIDELDLTVFCENWLVGTTP